MRLAFFAVADQLTLMMLSGSPRRWRGGGWLSPMRTSTTTRTPSSRPRDILSYYGIDNARQHIDFEALWGRAAESIPMSG